MHRVDVTDNDACKQFRDDVIREHGAVHILFNNAGISASGRQVYDDNVSPEG
jgi:NAD(P)-dependent dehydrogenase (short-subunit alcohol dehydrogenase family)